MATADGTHHHNTLMDNEDSVFRLHLCMFPAMHSHARGWDMWCNRETNTAVCVVAFKVTLYNREIVNTQVCFSPCFSEETPFVQLLQVLLVKDMGVFVLWLRMLPWNVWLSFTRHSPAGPYIWRGNFGHTPLAYCVCVKETHYMQHPIIEFHQSSNVGGEGPIATVRSGQRSCIITSVSVSRSAVKFWPFPFVSLT